VLFKIDGGVDHILVDEAQDTNPEQWSIIERLAEEFFAGVGASDKLRTCSRWATRSNRSTASRVPTPFASVRSGGISAPRRWRSSRRERCSAHPLFPLDRSRAQGSRCGVQQTTLPPRASCSEDGKVIEHHAFRTGQAGLVELWPVLSDPKIEPAEAFEPWNEDAAPPHAVDVLCQRIAGQIKAWLDKEEKHESEGRKSRLATF
jgi:ATP-dependent helicase/nuclease subunit A